MPNAAEGVGWVLRHLEAVAPHASRAGASPRVTQPSPRPPPSLAHAPRTLPGPTPHTGSRLHTHTPYPPHTTLPQPTPTHHPCSPCPMAL